METRKQNIEGSIQKLEAVVFTAVSKIGELKKTNSELRTEINELKRLLALSEKKADRLRGELDEFKNNGQHSWQNREKDIKDRLLRLSAKISAFENNFSVKS
jgi:FtsZ-binding cell division protein ZapB